jgi:hypothetical protein
VQLTQDQVRAFVGPNANYYVERWHPIHELWGSRALGFNWAAFFLALSWMLYRRMYRTFWIALGVWVGSVMLLTVACTAAILTHAVVLGVLLFGVVVVLPIVFQVIIGVYGTYWYYLHAQNQVSRLTPAAQTDSEALGRMGGTRLWGAVVFSVLGGLVVMWARHIGL